jgi:hypothetical protein
MSYKTLITNNVTNAFNLVGDIAEDITLTNETVDGYDFASQTIVNGNTTTKTVKGIVSKEYKTNDDKPRINADIILKTSDIDSKTLDGYDSLVFRSKTWGINKYEDNGYIITLTVGREV